MSAAAERKKHHQMAVSHLRAGALFQALEILSAAYEKFGPHVGLLSDLAAVYSLLGRVEDCRRTTLLLQTELEKCRSELSDVSLAQTLVFVGKMREEQGHVVEALRAYQEACNAVQSPKDLSARIRAQAQLLRLQSFLNIKTGLSDLYENCLKFQSSSEQLIIELQHALILAEISLFGPSFAEARLNQILSSQQLSVSDRFLVTVDFVEELLSQKLDSQKALSLTTDLRLVDGDEFEKLVILATRPAFEIDAKDLNKLRSKLPLMNVLRTLHLVLRKSRDRHMIVECKRLFHFHLQGLEAQSRVLLIKKWNLDLSNDDVSLLYNPSRGILFFEGKSMLFKKESISAQCLACMVGHLEMDLEDFTWKVFGNEYNPSYWDRIRMALVRLNKELTSFTGHSKLFQLTKTTVKIRAQIQTSANEGSAN